MVLGLRFVGFQVVYGFGDCARVAGFSGLRAEGVRCRFELDVFRSLLWE